ncbi:MAG: sulfite exporter TauE/SafE family protein [Chloroflexi bacterium]|nr:MAG: sulfite exporter TauE/SafE family protein [Chloroflexota bacterium]
MNTILTYILVGFVAQLIDGALGMAYGVSSTTFLISVGVAPALASASVHISEMFTTAVSGLAHLKFGNVNHALFRKLVVPGVVGGALGAYVLTAVPGEIIKPLLSLYLLAMGVRILFKSFRVVHASEIVVDGRLVPLAAIGGFSDAIGGGGWGPIVTTTLVAQGGTPRMVIGSVNLAEFFVTIAESLTFVLALGSALTQHWEIIVGLLSGGMLAAPLAAYVCQKLPTRALMGLVGTVIVLLSLRTLYLL